MHARGGSQWKKRERNSLGPLRRAHPASGATWNVQVVRGKMSTRCLWHACRALILGIILMSVGAGMATIGYYSNDFPFGEFRNNSAAVRIKNDQRGLHLNNLSYVGPIIMGVGGFIIVASCVMTFEARDSAAKVVPAKFKLSGQRNNNSASRGQRRTTSVQSAKDSRKSNVSQQTRWEQQMGLFKSSPVSELPHDRHALTAALVHFSRTIGSPKPAPVASTSRRISKSGSVPNLAEMKGFLSPVLVTGSPSGRTRIVKHHHRKGPRHSSVVQRSTRENGFLHPGMLRFHRHALSVDEGGPYLRQQIDSAHGSQGSVTFDPQLAIINDIVPIHKKRDRNKRSETAKRHVLSRQSRTFETEDNHSPHKRGINRRRSSTLSDASASSRRNPSRRASSTSRTFSFDSRCSHHPLGSNTEVDELEQEQSPDIQKLASPQKSVYSTPSVEKEFKSQLSICSEPTVAVRNLSCQSSIEPCVPEEDSPDAEDREKEQSFTPENEKMSSITGSTQVIIETQHKQESPKSSRPDSLILNTTSIDNNLINGGTDSKQQKYLYRSYSTRSFKKTKPKPSKLLSNDLDRIFVISSHDDDYYDSIEVISERRSKNFSKFYENELENVEKIEENVDKQQEDDVKIEIDLNQTN